MMKNKTNLLLSTLLVIALLFTACVPADDVQNSTIEAKYARAGSHRTATANGGGYTIFYPRGLADAGYPVIIWGNGIGTPTIAYTPLLTHLASWGFVVLASNNSMDYNGRTLINGIDYVFEQNDNPSSTFYGKLDTSRIGVAGHSLGGGAAIGAATDDRVACSAGLAPAADLTVPFAASKVKGPVLLMTGALDYIISPVFVKNTFNDVVKAGNVPAIFAKHRAMDHISFAWTGGGATGYLTAWFAFQLQDDPVASGAFIDGCEICNNEKWTEIENNFDSFY